MIFNIIKTIHIISFISWMAGLFYLPRIFVYHSNLNIAEDTSMNFKNMERRLYKYICNPAALFTWLSGLSLSYYNSLDNWLILKMFFVLLLTFFHLICGRYVKKFNNNSNVRSHKFFRFFNEVPTVLLILIIITVVFKPF